jgi:hypothetical protein
VDKFDSSIGSSIDTIASSIALHEQVIDKYVEHFKLSRKKEIQMVALRKQKKENYFAPMLLGVVKRSRPISVKDYVVNEYLCNQQQPVKQITLSLVVVNRSYTDHISTGPDQHYETKRVLRTPGLRISNGNDRDWVINTVERVNYYNQVARNLKDAFLFMVETHYSLHDEYSEGVMVRQEYPDHDQAAFEYAQRKQKRKNKRESI